MTDGEGRTRLTDFEKLTHLQDSERADVAGLSAAIASIRAALGG